MKPIYYTVVVRKTVTFEQKMIVCANTAADAKKAAREDATESNAATTDRDWRVVSIEAL